MFKEFWEKAESRKIKNYLFIAVDVGQQCLNVRCSRRFIFQTKLFKKIQREIDSPFEK